MRVAVDVSPLKNNHFLQHRVRGIGFYIENLKRALLKYDLNNKYIFFVRGENLPKDIDIVHYPYFEPFFLTLPVLKRYKTIVTVHDLTPLVFPQNFPAGLKGKLKWSIQRLVLRNANRIIADSVSSKRDIIKFTGADEKKIDVVYLASSEDFKKVKISDERHRELKEKYNLPDKFILYVGDVTWNKNLPRLIKAIKTIDLNLLMVGKALKETDFDKNNPWNQDRIEVQNLIRSDDKIITLGFIQIEDLVALYNLATVFVMPSLYEGFGLPILEAMNCGCPVVTTREGSIPEIAGDAAFYVDAYDIKSIANGIRKVYEDNKLKVNLIKKGLMQAEKFSWQKTALETVKAYEKTY